MNDPTIASVLDKSIDKLSGGASEVAKAVKQMAPHAWEVAVRQQVVEGWSGLVIPALVLLVAISAVRFWLKNGPAYKLRAQTSEKKRYPSLNSNKAVEECDADDYWMVTVLGGIVFLVAVAFSLGCAISSIRQLANPEYYAAMAILQAAK